MRFNLCQMDDIGISCMGCCGHNFKDRIYIERALVDNTQTFMLAKDKRAWGVRHDDKYVMDCGMCHNIIKIGEKVFCPLHPTANKGEDLRDSSCDKNYLCKTFIKFNTWDDKKRQEFVDFIKSNSYDWFEYSMGMESGTILQDFETNYKSE